MKYPSREPIEDGFTLTELLVVASIIAVLTVLAIPALLRMGVFTSDATGESARDLYQSIRAARLYATTNNVETAIVYRARLEFDTANDELDPLDLVPIIDGYMVCRRATQAELDFVNTNFLVEDLDNLGNKVGDDEPVFIPIEGTNGDFRPMLRNTCVLPDVFEVDPGDPRISLRGLSPVFVIDPSVQTGDLDETGFARPPAHPLDDTVAVHFQQEDGDDLSVLDDGVGGVAIAHTFELTNPPAAQAQIEAFPAHRFSSTGEMLPIQDVQRFTMRVGMIPTTLPSDRFVTDDADTEYDDLANPTDVELLTVQFHGPDPLDPSPQDAEIVPLYHDPRRVDDPDYVAQGFDLGWYLENTTNLSVYTATGRVKIEPSTPPPFVEEP